MQSFRGGWRGVCLVPCSDSRSILVFLSSTAIRDDQGSTLGVIGIAQDISMRKRAEEGCRLGVAYAISTPSNTGFCLGPPRWAERIVSPAPPPCHEYCIKAMNPKSICICWWQWNSVAPGLSASKSTSTICRCGTTTTSFFTPAVAFPATRFNSKE